MQILARCLALLILLANVASAATLSASSVLPPHPRLLATPADWQQLSSRIAADPRLQEFVDIVVQQSRRDLALEPVERRLAGRRLLGVSREFIRRTLEWSFAYRFTGEAAFLERARREMLTVAAFADWNPSHYLDVAEMTTGMAIAYDWLYAGLPAAERDTIRRAIVDKGIAQARHGHKTFQATNNWSQVCMGGMVLGALAVQEDQPELAADLLAAARKDAMIGLAAYQPDGVYPEGPSYWDFGSTYEVLLIAALRGTLNDDWGLMAAPGFKRSAEFYAQAVGPSGKSFDFADGGEGQILSAAIFYLARELEAPALVGAKLDMIRNKNGLRERFAPLIALWWPMPEKDNVLPLSYAGQGPQPVAIWRSSWNDPAALYFAIKGGGAAHNHAHMDGGSFVLDLDGVRWAKDLGMQDYGGLEAQGVDLWNMKQDSGRWKVFRLGSDAHNTLTIDGAPHSAMGMAKLRMKNASETVLDMTPLFLPGQVLQAERSARFEGQTVSLRDEVKVAQPGSVVRWAMNSEADISVNGSHALLKMAGRTLHVHFSGAPVTLEVRDISKPTSKLDAANPNVRQLLAFAKADADGLVRLAVSFSRD